MKKGYFFSKKITAFLLPVLLLLFLQLQGLAQEALDPGIWHGIAQEGFPSAGWTIQNNTLTLAAGKKGGDLITREKYSDFDLQLEYKLAPSANTGIKYFVELLTSGSGKKVTGIGLEFQLIDDFNHPEVKDNKHPEGSTAALYLIYAPNGNKQLNTPGQWNKVRIVAKGKKVEHWLNGKKVLSYERGGQQFKSLVAATKFKDYPGYGELAEGHILLQDHGDEASFRNIKLKRL
jgi:hypothetical protein